MGKADTSHGKSTTRSASTKKKDEREMSALWEWHSHGTAWHAPWMGSGTLADTTKNGTSAPTTARRGCDTSLGIGVTKNSSCVTRKAHKAHTHARADRNREPQARRCG